MVHAADIVHVALVTIARFTQETICGVMESPHSAVLAFFYVQVKGVMFYDLSITGAGWGDSCTHKHCSAHKSEIY